MKNKWLLILSAIIILFLLASFSFFGDDSDFLTVPVRKGDIAKSITANGILIAKNRVEVNSRMTGTLKKLYVKLGQKVKKGQLLAKIDSIIEQQELSQSQSSLTEALAQERTSEIKLVKARKIWSREQEMAKSEATSQAALQDAEFNLQLARSNLAACKAQSNLRRAHVKESQVKLGYASIRAPMSGIITQIVTNEGEHVVVSVDAPIILRLAQLDTMTLKASISEVDIIRIRKGQEAYFRILGLPNRRFKVVLRDIEQNPSNTGGGTYYSVYFDTPNPKRIFRVGMTAEVVIVLKEAKNALLIPSSVLEKRNRDGRYIVKILDSKGKVQQRLVKIGINDHSMAQVLSGLKLNEKVIVGTKKNEDEATERETPSPQKKSKRAIRLL